MFQNVTKRGKNFLGYGIFIVLLAIGIFIAFSKMNSDFNTPGCFFAGAEVSAAAPAHAVEVRNVTITHNVEASGDRMRTSLLRIDDMPDL